MKIAIEAPGSSPFVTGVAENLVRGLQSYLINAPSTRLSVALDSLSLGFAFSDCSSVRFGEGGFRCQGRRFAMSQHRRSVSRRAGPRGCYESDVYRAFEDEHRGSRELIKSRLRVCLLFVEPLKEICLDCRAVDLGCGQGGVARADGRGWHRRARHRPRRRHARGLPGAQGVSRFDVGFGQNYGVNLDSLAMHYDRRIGDRLDEILARVERSTELSARQAQERAEQAEARVRQAQGEMWTVRQELHNVHQANHHHWQLAEERGRHVQALLSSTSWRVTAPIRWVVTSLRLLGRMPGRVVVRLRIWLKPRVVRVVTSPAPQRMIERTGRWVIARGRLSDPIRVFLRRHERLRNRWLILGLPPPGVVIAAQEECVELAARKPRLPAILGTKGVNARQRTPLESNFLAYPGPE